MGLSNYLPTSAIAKPGVCTSSTRPASPYDGQVIYETDTDKTLVWNGSAWVYLSTSTANPVGMELVKTQTIGTAVSSVTVSDAFNSSFDNYWVLVNGGTASSSNAAMKLYLGSSNGNYYSTLAYGAYGGGGLLQATNNNASEWNWIGGMFGSNGFAAEFRLMGPYLAAYTRVFSQAYEGASNGGSLSGIHKVASSYASFTLLPEAGTLTGGTICVYGYKK